MLEDLKQKVLEANLLFKLAFSVFKSLIDFFNKLSQKNSPRRTYRNNILSVENNYTVSKLSVGDNGRNHVDSDHSRTLGI